MPLILRTVKGSPLTYQEMDDNLTYLSSSLSQSISSSYATTASYALNAGGGTGVGFPFTGSARITGSLLVTGSTNITGSLGVIGPVSITGSTNITGSLRVAGNITATGSLLLKSDDVNLSTTNTLLFIDNSTGTNKVASIDGIYKNATRAMIETNDKLGALDLTFVGTGNTSGFSKGLVIPTSQSLNPVNGSIYWDSTTSRLLIYDGGTAAWVQVVLAP